MWDIHTSFHVIQDAGNYLHTIREQTSKLQGNYLTPRYFNLALSARNKT